MMRLKWIWMTAVALGAFFAGGWLLRRGMATMTSQGGSAPGPPVSAGSSDRLFSAVLETVRGHAVDSLDDATIYGLATSGVLGELQDPYAALVSAADTSGPDRIGAAPVQGLYLDRVDGFVEVVATVPGSPAAVAGIRPGDAVLRVDRVLIDLQRPEAVARLIDGDSGTSVKVRLGREGGGPPLWVTIDRGPVPRLLDSR